MGIFDNIKRAVCGEPEEPTLTADQQSALDAAQQIADENGFNILTNQAQARQVLREMAEQGRKLRERK